MDFPGNLAGKESACNAGDPRLIPRLGSSPAEGIDYPLQYSWASLVAQCGEGNGNPLQYSCLESFMNRGAWSATVHGVTES